jgi:crotonobetainyl-CoA:carnitine CoA-transferase CaiB-like acyl-CoA transferase
MSKFSSVSQRKKNAAELSERIEQITSQYPAAKLVRLLQKAGVPAEVVQNAEELAQDPHLLERDYFTRLPHPVLGETISDRSPIRFSEDVSTKWKSAPSLGEANSYVFIDLMGLSEVEYASYVDRGIIA